MPRFRYNAVDNDGQVLDGTLEAESRSAGIQTLSARGIYVAEIFPVEENIISSIGTQPKISRKELLAFTNQLTSLLEAGIEVDKALGLIAEQASSSTLQLVTRELRNGLRAGSNLADSFRRFPLSFPSFYVGLVRVGESTGTLDAVLRRSADYLEAQITMRRFIINSITYPIVVLCVAFGSLSVMLYYVVPRFARVFTQLNRELPLPTKILLKASQVLADYWWVALLGTILLIIVVRWYSRLPEGKKKLDIMKIRFPIFGPIVRTELTANFARIMSTLLSSGVDLRVALGIYASAEENTQVAEMVMTAKEKVESGGGLADSLAPKNVFTPLAIQMIRVGEETGQLEQLLHKVAVTFENEVKNSVRGLLTLLEPALILTMAVIVAGVVLMMLAPIVSLNSFQM